MKKILILNGPNLNSLGTREPEVYGGLSFEEYLTELQHEFISVTIEYYQSNVEGELINKLHEVGFVMMALYLMQEDIHIHLLRLLTQSLQSIRL